MYWLIGFLKNKSYKVRWIDEVRTILKMHSKYNSYNLKNKNVRYPCIKS